MTFKFTGVTAHLFHKSNAWKLSTNSDAHSLVCTVRSVSDPEYYPGEAPPFTFTVFASEASLLVSVHASQYVNAVFAKIIYV